jgi:hypothetical protein
MIGLIHVWESDKCGGQVYLLDPVPIARLREEWEFVSLVE